MRDHKKNRLAIVVCAWPPMAGGIGNNAYYQAKELAKLGYRVGVFSLFKKESLFLEEVESEKLPALFRFGHAGFLFGLCKKLKTYDLIHFYYPFFGADLQLILFKLIFPKKKVVLHYEMDPIGQGSAALYFRLHLFLFLPLSLALADKVGVLSFDHAENSYLAPYLKKYPDKFLELPNGIEADLFNKQEQDLLLRQKLGLGLDEKVIIFVGGLDRQHFFKGVDVLLESFKKLIEGGNDNLKLLIVGDGDLRQEFEVQAERLEITPKVIFAGWVKNEELPKYYNLADVFVLPSVKSTESFGIVIAEAQACGLPAVISNWPGSRQTILENETGYLVNPGDVDELAEKIKKILDNNDLAAEMGDKAAINAKEKYDWKNIARKMDELYQKLILK